MARTGIDLEEDAEMYSLILQSVKNPSVAFNEDPSLGIVLQTLFVSSIASGLLYPLGRLTGSGTLPLGQDLTVVFALSIFQFLLIVPVVISLEAILVLFPLRILGRIEIIQVFKASSLGASVAPLVALTAALPQPLTATVLIPLAYMFYIQSVGIKHYLHVERRRIQTSSLVAARL